MKRRKFIQSATAAAGIGITGIPEVPAEQNQDIYYNQLADALNKLPNAFPRTKSNVELLLLKKICSPEQAKIASSLTGTMESIDAVAARIGLSVEETRTKLKEMSGLGLILGNVDSGMVRLRPFVIGIYEAQLERMDHELAHLFEEYMDQGGAELMRPQPALHRVIPAQSAVKKEWVIPYDDLREMLLTSKSFRLRDCICRKQQDLIGERKCDFPLKVELIFSPSEWPETPQSVSREKALEVLDETEKIGLVHTVSNVADRLYYVCNCCGCCCGILRGITEWGIEKSVAVANYYSVIDPGECKGCGICVGRCQVKAVTLKESVAVVDRGKCIGCGLCVSGCPQGVARLERKPENEIIEPPVNFAEWEKERLKNRGLI